MGKGGENLLFVFLFDWFQFLSSAGVQGAVAVLLDATSNGGQSCRIHSTGTLRFSLNRLEMLIN